MSSSSQGPIQGIDGLASMYDAFPTAIRRERLRQSDDGCPDQDPQLAEVPSWIARGEMEPLPNCSETQDHRDGSQEKKQDVFSGHTWSVLAVPKTGPRTIFHIEFYIATSMSSSLPAAIPNSAGCLDVATSDIEFFQDARQRRQAQDRGVAYRARGRIKKAPQPSFVRDARGHQAAAEQPISGPFPDQRACRATRAPERLASGAEYRIGSSPSAASRSSPFSQPSLP